MIECPFCQAVNEASVRNDLLRPGISRAIGPVWQCNVCDKQWTDWEADEILDKEEPERRGRMTDEQRQIITMHMDLIASNCVHTAAFLTTTPAALGLYVDQDATRCWHIRARHHASTPLPAGSGVLAWDTDRYPDVETAFQAALADAWQARSQA